MERLAPSSLASTILTAPGWVNMGDVFGGNDGWADGLDGDDEDEDEAQPRPTSVIVERDNEHDEIKQPL